MFGMHIAATHILFLVVLSFVSNPVNSCLYPPVFSLVLMCSAGQSMNRWSLEEMVKRDPENFLILLQQIIRKTREVGHTGDTRGGRVRGDVCPWMSDLFVFVFRFRSSASMSWWLLWPSCSFPHCCRYLPSLLCCTWAGSQWSISTFCEITKSSFLNWCFLAQPDIKNVAVLIQKKVNNILLYYKMLRTFKIKNNIAKYIPAREIH